MQALNTTKIRRIFAHALQTIIGQLREQINICTCTDEGMPVHRASVWKSRLFAAWLVTGNFTGNFKIITREALALLELSDLPHYLADHYIYSISF